MRTWLIALLTSAALVIGLLVGAPTATAASTRLSARMTVTTTNTVPWFPLTGEWDELNSERPNIVARADELNVTVFGGTSDRMMSLRIRLETGQRFQLGRTDPGRLGLSAELWYRDVGNCGLNWFNVRDLAYEGDTIVRLDVSFMTYCSEQILGDLQLGERAAGALAGVRSLIWPDTPIGTRHPLVLPVWVRNAGSTSLPLGSLQRLGSQAAEFPLVSDRCSGRTLRSREGCLIEVRFRPATPGPKNAALTLSAGGQPIRVDLTGTAPSGRSVLEVHRPAGPYDSPAVDRLFTDVSSTTFARGFENSVEVEFAAPGQEWTLWLRTPDYRPLKLGPQRFGYAPVDPTLPELSLSGDGVGCTASGTMNLKQLELGAYGEVKRFSLSIRHTCIGDPTVLRAEISYRATDTPPPPSGQFVLRTGQSIPVGGTLRTFDARGESQRLTLQKTGQAVITDRFGRQLWASPFVGRTGAYRLTVRADGSLAIVDAKGRAVWRPRPVGVRSGDFLLLQRDGNLVLYTPDYHPLLSALPI